MNAHQHEPAPRRAQPLKMAELSWHAVVAVQDDDMPVDTGGETTGPALHEMLAMHYGALHQRLTRYLGCADLASDSLHDTWLRLVGKTSTGAVQNPQAYLYRAACNTAMDLLDSRRRHQGEADFELQMEVTADDAPGPAAIAEAGSELRALARVCERLPKLQLSILLALRIDQRPRSEVAQQYGISLRKVDRALAQALAFCAEQMTMSHPV